MSSTPSVVDSVAKPSLEVGAEYPRVLLISDRYFPHVGGSIQWFHNIYTRRPPGTVAIHTQRYENDSEFDARNPEIRMVRRRLRRYPFLKPESLVLYLKLLWTGARIIRKHKIDVIHVSKVLPEGFVARWLSKLCGVPYIQFAHGEEITIFGRNPKQRKHLPAIYDGAAAVIANSRFTADKLREVGCEGSNVARISPGVDPAMFSPGPKDVEILERHQLRGRKVILSVGRLTKRKGQDHVIDAMPEVLLRHPDAVYLVLSGGEEAENLRERARAGGVEEQVIFAGEVDFADLPRYYRSCDVFVLANRELPDGDMEGFGIVFLEANACARPVIAGSSGGTGDPVRDGVNGLRIDATQPRNIAAAICRVLDDPASGDQMGREGRRIVEDEYAWDKVVERIENVSRRVVSGGRIPEAECELNQSPGG